MRLTGTVMKRRFWGPPNFGENPKTDRRVSVYVFRPATRLLTCDGGDVARQLTVVPFGKKHRLGRQSLTGTVSHADAASQFLEYIFDVE